MYQKENSRLFLYTQNSFLLEQSKEESAENVATSLKMLREIVNEILFITMILNGSVKIQNFITAITPKNSLTFSHLKGALTCFEETECYKKTIKRRV